MTVYIPTRGRTENVKVVVPHWLEQDMQVRLIVDRFEYQAYQKLKREMKWDKDVYVYPVPLQNRGIGYVRQQCVVHAKNTGVEAFIMADDDLRPHPDSDFWDLIDEAERPGVLGIGATRSIHGLMSGGATDTQHGPILCPGGWGFQIFALNVKTTFEVGNFNPRLHSLCEDAELARQGIAAGIPWRVHCDVKCVPIGKRYDPGGINSRFHLPESRTAAERECMDIVHKLWPDYTNPPDKRLRTAWSRMLDDYLPKWRDYSAMHGGDLKKLKVR